MTDLVSDKATRPLAGRRPRLPDRMVYRAYADAAAYIDDIYSFYQEMYDLPVLRTRSEVVEEALFNYCKDRRYFVNILPYTVDERVLLSPAFSGDELAWRIVGGSVKDSFQNDFVSVSTEHLRRYVPDVELGEVEPVAFLENTFSYLDQTHVHLGILFIGRVRNFDNKSFRDSVSSSRGHFVSIGRTGARPHLPQIYQAEALERAAPRIARALKYVTQDGEIDVNLKYQRRYKIHEVVGKPVMRLLSRFIGKHTLRELGARIERELLADGARSLLDVACGENLELIKLVQAGKLTTFVGNDISWSQVALIQGILKPKALRNNEGIVLFTNHDGRRLPFRDKAFDTVVCKNVLHHMPDRASAQGLISEICRVGRRAVIVEVMDPALEGRWGRLRHRYYMDFLKDAGGNFLSREEFSCLLKPFGPAEAHEMQTFRGVYQFAIMSTP